ncbi:MAG: hypothetical protein A3J29_06200 [Acidobacteria bacterium RIFCSPLOWO2_12_FULL_67_14b]|nr:MAG: hypothetical protein A3J29_06200 [Acidobacteria bacterium RIFCSPLOWO2_12_FULL_67_14b]
MAWTTIVLVSTGELATANVQNTQVLGNLNELRTGGLAMTNQANGRIVVASSASQLSPNKNAFVKTFIEAMG